MLPKPTRTLGLLIVLLMGTVGVVGLAVALEVGEQGPDFTLPSATGAQIGLSQFRPGYGAWRLPSLKVAPSLAGVNWKGSFEVRRISLNSRSSSASAWAGS
jgi:hypothetical protein